jgi:hypothetical protein
MQNGVVGRGLYGEGRGWRFQLGRRLPQVGAAWMGCYCATRWPAGYIGSKLLSRIVTTFLLFPEPDLVIRRLGVESLELP